MKYCWDEDGLCGKREGIGGAGDRLGGWRMEREEISTLAASSTGSSPRHPVPVQAKVRPQKVL
jgi:hypothetical protein